MKIVVFCHSLLSDWNHGNAHFLRGVTRELIARGHEVAVYEPADSWSRANLVADHGLGAMAEIEEAFPELSSTLYDPGALDPEAAIGDADLVIVHEWNDPVVVAAIGYARSRGTFQLLFHDTHHRAVSRPEEMARYELDHYDGVLAFGSVIRDLYLERGWAQRAWTWHEAADVRTFHPIDGVERQGDLVWIGNWGDGERTAELHEFLMQPVQELGLRCDVYGVRYPGSAQRALAEAGIKYRGWLPNHRVPEVFAAHGVTIHVPRRPYVEALPGIPTIRPFEALACGIPLVSAPWDDVEELFTPGVDFLVAKNGDEMAHHLRDVLHDHELASSLRANGVRVIHERHTCGHRADELLAIAGQLGLTVAPAGLNTGNDDD
ncbi:MAG: a-glycosyltransferase, Glycosyltransferase Family 4-like protein [Acidimicrobiia bacterium]|nr:a-glycosyltransferase, Glycosyltransferase Family 4-like protein [Acidimicrobiia bacterium]